MEIHGDEPVPEPEVLYYLASLVRRALREEIAPHLEHLDEQVHDVRRQVTAITGLLEQHRPLLERASRLTGGPIASSFRRGK